ncbi:MAG TPA: tetratricopeptide repeat protein [Pseudonocardiaceae bacterium]|nr:tetratricopeptide repeat protein [Pseudonocardiaceae bacterium]
MHASKPARVPTPRQLPADTANFTGRSAELARLDSLLGENEELPPAKVMLATISGMAGVGKTALAVHWTRGIRDSFPDGDLYVDLRGYAHGEIAEAEDVLEQFLRALDVAPERIPLGLDARAALYRSLLNGRRMLIVLDNAANSRHVRPLLPGSADCLVVVTSRRRLVGLVANGSAHALALSPILPSEAAALLERTLGPERTAPDPGAVMRLAQRCGYLPLALRIAAERAAARTDMTMAELSAELANDDHRLDVLTAADDETEAVRTAFSWSYHALPDDAAWLFRLLGLHAGQRIGIPAIAALADIPPDRAKRLLDILVDSNILDRISCERYQFPPLLHSYAAECTLLEEPARRDAALLRLLGWYLHSARAAARAAQNSLMPPETDGSRPPRGTISFTTWTEALAWYQLEHVNLVSAARQAAAAGQEALSWRIARTCGYFLALRGSYADLTIVADIGLAAARQSWDELGEAHMLILYGIVAAGAGRVDDAIRLFQESLAVWWAIGDQIGKCNALNEIGLALRELKIFDDAIDYLQRCRDCSRVFDSPVTEGYALHNLGDTMRGLGRPQEAVGYLREALAVRREIGDPQTESHTVHSLGHARQDVLKADPAYHWTDPEDAGHRP